MSAAAQTEALATPMGPGYTSEELKAIRDEYCKGASDSQFLNFIREARTRNLIPGKHLYFQVRTVKEYDDAIKQSIYVKRAIHLTSIDFFRLTAQRTGEYQGQKRPVWLYASTTQNSESGFYKSEIPLSSLTPYAVEVSVFRKNFQEPITVTARFDAYAVYYKDGSGFKLNSMWEKRGPEQLAKCAEAQALRQAFPEELGGLYIAEEIRDESPDAATLPLTPEAPSQSTPVRPPFPENTPNSVGVPKAIIPKELDPTFDVGGPPNIITEEFPTKEERTAFVNRLRYYMTKILPKAGVENSETVLKTFVQKFSGIESTKNLTKTQWETLLTALDAAKEAGTLKRLVEVGG